MILLVKSIMIFLLGGIYPPEYLALTENSVMRAETEKTLNQLRKVMDEGDDIRKFIRPQEGIRIYSLSRTFFNEIAKEAGAMYKIGKKVVLVEVEPSFI